MNSDPKRVYYPLTHPQLGIWQVEKYHPGTSINNIAATAKIKGLIDFEQFEKAVNQVIEKHEGLRLRLVEIDGEPFQYVADYEYDKIPLLQFDSKEDLYSWDEEKTRTPFDIIDNKLYYFALVKVGNEYAFYGKLHHLISDGWSVVLIANLVFKEYMVMRKGGHIQPISNSYIDYILSEIDYKNSEKFQKDREFWHNKLRDIDDLTALKTRTSSKIKSHAGRKTFIIPNKLTNKLQQYCSTTKNSSYSVFMAALFIYIYRVTGRKDIIIGTPILNRVNKKEKDTIGMFASTVPVRIVFDENLPFCDLVKKIVYELIGVLRHQKYPFNLIQKEIREKTAIEDKLFDIGISYHNGVINKSIFEHDSEFRWHFNNQLIDSLYIHISQWEGDKLMVEYDYLKDLFYDKEIEFIHDHIIRLLWHGIDNPNKEIYMLDMMSEVEKKKIMFEFNNTEADYPKDKCIHTLFEEQVERTPDQIALVFEGKKMTYRELNERANQLAWRLRDEGVKPDTRVGLMVDRSFEMIIGMMGILKAGGAYVPIEPDYPDERVKHITDDAQITILLTQGYSPVNFQFQGKIVNLNDEENYSNRIENLPFMVQPHHLVYVIYTSGSTGKPKGVMIEHRGLVNFSTAVKKVIEFNEKMIILSSTTMMFDISAFEIFPSLIGGAQIIIANDEERNQPDLLCDLIKKTSINTILTTPSKLELLIKADNSVLNNLKQLMLGGEIFSRDLLKNIKKVSKCRIFNGYGPTEITIGATFKELTLDDTINIGKPISNIKMYILDEKGNLVPIGTIGELCISGEGVARGYMNSKESTNAMFTQNPYESGLRLYKTGDLAKWKAKGEIEYIGRRDSQIKLHGYRIELGEIEHRMKEIPGIMDCVVSINQENPSHTFLCAYYVSNLNFKSRALRNILKNFLPSYMVPSYFMKIDKIPLNSNGKVDRKLLTKPGFNLEMQDYLPPTTQTEKELAKIWSQVLGKERIGILDDFFELGGDSLKMLTLISKINGKFIINLPIIQIKTSPTMKEIAKYIDNSITFIDKFENNHLVKIKDGKSKEKNLFLIHDGFGEVNIYTLMCAHLSDDYNCWGIKYGQLHNLAPKKTTIEDLASSYIRIIKNVQPSGEYNVIGWSLGGTIAFEVVRQLEEKKCSVKLLGLIDSVSNFNTYAVEYDDFSLETEIRLIKDYLGINLPIHSSSNTDDMWFEVLKYIKNNDALLSKIINLIPKQVVKSIMQYSFSNLPKLIYYLNVMRSLHAARMKYVPLNKISTSVVYFKAADGFELNREEFWTNYCIHPLVVHKIDGDHYSIFEEPNINQLSNILNSSLLTQERKSQIIAQGF